jgi:hypothetical protein
MMNFHAKHAAMAAVFPQRLNLPHLQLRLHAHFHLRFNSLAGWMLVVAKRIYTAWLSTLGRVKSLGRGEGVCSQAKTKRAIHQLTRRVTGRKKQASFLFAHQQIRTFAVPRTEHANHWRCAWLSCMLRLILDTADATPARCKGWLDQCLMWC